MSKGKNIISNIFGGKILIGLSNHWLLSIYIFVLITIFIAIRFSIIENKKIILANEKELIELKIKYSEENAVLIDMCRRTEIEKRLKTFNSTLEVPYIHPQKVKEVKNGWK
jgi:hypothetical protein